MKHIFPKNHIEQFCKLVEGSTNVVVVTHTNPDGDAIGSATAIGKFLTNLKISNSVWTPNRYPAYLAFIADECGLNIFEEESERFKSEISKADLIICADFNQLKRVDQIEKYIKKSKASKILIDHHPDPETEYFNLVLSNSDMSSTCECFYEIIQSSLKINPALKMNFTKSVAESLYLGIMTDTNNFANSVLPGTFMAAANLVKKGVNKEYLQHKVFGFFSEERMRLMGYILLKKMKILPQYNAAYIVLTKEELAEFKFREGDSEGFVNLPLNIENVNISALFTENEDHVRVSLRSINDFSVNKLSREFFNGAGHERAAGGKLFLPIDEVGSYFEEKLGIFIGKFYMK